MNATKPTLAIVVTAILGVLLVPSLLGAALSPMFFDAPVSTHNPSAYVNALVVVSFPCLSILSIVASWILWLWQKRRSTRISLYAQIAAAVLPLIPVAYFATALAIEMGGVVASNQPMGLHSTIIRHHR